MANTNRTLVVDDEPNDISMFRETILEQAEDIFSTEDRNAELFAGALNLNISADKNMIPEYEQQLAEVDASIDAEFRKMMFAYDNFKLVADKIENTWPLWYELTTEQLAAHFKNAPRDKIQELND